MKQKKRIVPLLCIVFLLTACGKAGGTEMPTPTDAPVSTITLAPTETSVPTEIPAPTELPSPTAAPLPTNTPTPAVEPTAAPEPAPVESGSTETPVPTESPLLTYATVTPVPQSAVVDIVGTMTVDTYPVVDGSTATLPLSEAVFMAATGESAEVAAEQVVHTKTTNSYNRLYNGEVDLLIVYEPAQSIVERMQTEPLCIKPIGLDALVFLANTANPLTSLTMEQLVDIYSGKITNWAEVGGNEKELLAFQRPLGSGSQTLMEKLVMGDIEMTSGDNVFRYSTMSDILEGMLSYNNEDNTLGYSVFYYANNMYFEKDLKLMGVDGVVPSTQTIYDGSYKLKNAFYAVVRTDEPADSNARKVFDWLTGEAGQQLVLDLGYVPVQMPEGADVSDVKVVQQEKIELLSKEPLEEGQYFVFVNPQNMVDEYYYGDMTVYNHNWEEAACFYNVTLNHNIQGIYKNRYLPVGQIRQNAEGEQYVSFGTFDLEQGEYAVIPNYSYLEVLDAERGYFMVPKSGGEWVDAMIINGAGEILLPEARMEDWMMIWKFGNGYQEMWTDYDHWENGTTYRYYDENLNLKYVYAETAMALPDDEAKIEGVEYILMEDGGCLVDADGNVVLNTGIFLDLYGDGENYDCQFQFYSPTLVEDHKVYAVKYCGQIFLLDSNLNAIRPIFDTDIVENFQNADFYESFCYYYSSIAGDWIYKTYEGQALLTSYGTIPDYIDKAWGSDAYMMYWRVGENVFVEEYTADGDLLKYTITLMDESKNFSLYYTPEGFLLLNEDSGETMQNPYSYYEEMIPLQKISLYYQGSLMEVEFGMEGADFYALEDPHFLWTVRNGEMIQAPSESLLEGYMYNYALGNYTLIEEQRVVYEMDNAYLIFRGNDAAFFIKGNYIYAVGFDGTEYIKALRTFMSTD